MECLREKRRALSLDCHWLKKIIEKAIELLQERFGKPQILTNAYMESLSKIDAPPADTKNLSTFYDTCEANIHGLEAFGAGSEIATSWSPMRLKI